MKDQVLGIVLLIAQVLLFLLQFLFSNILLLFTTSYLIVLFLTGLFISAFGYKSLGLHSYSSLPEPRKKNTFSKKDIRKYIRHPIYLGLMIICLAFLMSRFILIPTAIFFLFVVVTDIKANFEEQYLLKLHPKYKTYREKVFKYIPFLY